MDGNGRWAVNKGLPRALGHKKGASKVSEIVKACPDVPTAAPVNIDGKVPGSTIFQNKSICDAPIDWAALR